MAWDAPLEVDLDLRNRRTPRSLTAVSIGMGCAPRGRLGPERQASENHGEWFGISSAKLRLDERKEFEKVYMSLPSKIGLTP